MTMHAVNIWGRARSLRNLLEDEGEGEGYVDGGVSILDDVEEIVIPVLDEGGWREGGSERAEAEVVAEEVEEADGPDHYGWEEVYGLNGCSSFMG